MKMVGPTTNTNTINAIASAMLIIDRRLTPLSIPATTEKIARPVMAAMAMIWKVVFTGIDGNR